MTKSDPVDDETDEDEDINNESSKGPLKRFLLYRQLWSGTNNNQSTVLLNYSRESETSQRENEGVQWYSKK
ncbi:hypothetical protein TNCV_2325271 [Trichonephila clavipes]|nr:hypothetical protein TNCV_2325271 [Trichonephila clavipes]